jgi:hypothetical protein
MTLRPNRSLWILAIAALLPVALGNTCTKPVHPTPALSITFPPDGHFTNDATVTVSGAAHRGITSIADVTVNGVSALPLSGDPDDGTYSVVVPLDTNAIFNPIMVEMTLAGGLELRRRSTVIAGDGVSSGFANDGDLSPESIVMRLNDSGLDAVEPVITSLVNVDIGTLLPPGTLVIDDFCYEDSFLGCLGRVDATVSGSPPPSISSLGITVDSQTNFVDGDVRLHDLFIKTNIVAVTGIPFSCEATITAATTDILGDYGLQPDAVTPAEIDVFQIGGVNVVFGAFNDSTDCSGFFGGIVEFFLDLLVGDLQDIVEPQLETFLNTPDPEGNTPVAGAVEEALTAVEIAGPLGDALGVTLDTQLFTVDEDVDGITLGNDGAFTATPVFAGTCFDDVSGLEVVPIDPCSVADPCPVGQTCQGPAGECVAHTASPDLIASYEVSEVFPTFGPNAPGGSPYGLGLCLSTSAFNQLLKSQIECGLLTQDIDTIPGIGALSGFLLSFLIPEIAQFPLTTQYELLVRSDVAAIVTGNPGPAGEIAEVRLAGLEVKLRDVDRNLPTLIRLEADVTLGLDASFAAGELSFALTEPAIEDITLTFIHNQLGADEADLENVITGLFQLAVPALAGALGGFPLPEFLGLNLDLVEIDRAGEFMSLYLNLTPVP